MPTTTEFANVIERLVEASAQLADYAEQQGVSRAETAAALAAEVVHAVTVDPQLEARRDRFHADLDRYRADTAAYAARGTEIRDQLFAKVQALASLADEVTELTDEAVALEVQGRGIAGEAASLGEPAVPVVQVLEGLVQQMRADPSASIPAMRLVLASRHGRTATIAALADMAKSLPSER